MKCTSCGGEVVYDDSLQGYVCAKCGLVLDDRPIVADYPRPEREPRYSGGFTHRLHDHGVGGTVISGSLRRHVVEGRRWVARHVDIVMRGGRGLVKALRALNGVARALGTPAPVVETAAQAIAKYAESSGRRALGESGARKLAVAALYTALRIHGYSTTLLELASEAGFEQAELWPWVRALRESGFKPPIRGPNACVHKVAVAVKAPASVEALACELLSSAGEALSGWSPVTLAAGAVYLASLLLNVRVPQSAFRAVGRSDSAVRSAARSLVKALDIEILL